MSRNLNKLIYYSVTAFSSCCVLIIFVIYPGINDNKPSMFGDMIYGRASKPFVYRTLLPTTVRILSTPVPQSFRDDVSNKIENNNSLKKLFAKLKWEKEYAVEYSFAMLLMFLSLWGLAISVRYLFCLFYKSSYWLSASVSVFALLGLPPMFMYTSFIYDFPLLLLYTLGLIFLYKQEWKIFLIVFVIGCINKETTILLTLIFFLYYKGKLAKDIFNKLLAAQLVIFVLIKTALYILFKNNPGSFLEFHLIDHNLRLLTGYNLPLAVSLLGLVILVFYKWDEKPEFIKTTLWAIVPLILLSLFLGYIDELRDYYEIYSAVIILISHSIAKIFGIEINLPAGESNS